MSNGVNIKDALGLAVLLGLIATANMWSSLLAV